MNISRLFSSSVVRHNRLADLRHKLRKSSKSTNFYSESDLGSNSEVHVVRQFRRLVPEQLSRDTTAWEQLNAEKDLRELPEVPEQLTADSLDEYISELNRVKTRKFEDYPEFISTAFDKIVQSGLLREISKYNPILQYYSIAHDYGSIKKTMALLNERKIYPTTDSFNYILGPMRTASHRKKYTVITMYLKQMEIYNQRLNLSTCYILFECLDRQRKPVYEYLVENRCSLDPILPAVLRYRYEVEKSSFETLVEELRSKKPAFRSNPKVVAELVNILLMENNPDKAWEFAYESLEEGLDELPPAVLVHFVAYFAKNNQFYNAVAMINAFQNFFLGRKVHKVYQILALEMLNRPNSENWSMLTRRFCLDAKTSFNKTFLTTQELSKIAEKAHSYGYSDFVPDKLSIDEYDKTAELFNRLQWPNHHHPLFALEANTPMFQQAAAIFAC
ncbi:hypothetical protein OGAPHI_001548 [Ogataea philodendri]|uniref:Uncharacterized protein n=1 Tax=Ogataea philodendri TaxID=1378263 RepID=A0A9P8PCN9_9ASCO|nr:uncharacterized protein OGAPHI_001548 [Ogataea philodendri]KAH3669427.1 hypothetical protein OGAPHI_001548 [Ogataea philodendri]